MSISLQNAYAAIQSVVIAAWPDVTVVPRVQQLAYENWRDRIVTGKLALPYAIYMVGQTADEDDDGSDACTDQKVDIKLFYWRSNAMSAAELAAIPPGADSRVTTWLLNKGQTLADAIWTYQGNDFYCYSQPVVDWTEMNDANRVLQQEGDNFMTASVEFTAIVPIGTP